MTRKRLIIPPESALEYLLEYGYLEETDSYPKYRIAMDPETFRIYSITQLSNALAKKFHMHGFKSTAIHKRPYLRELYKCLNEYQIPFVDRFTKANERWEFKMTERKWLEQKLGIDMREVDEYDLSQRRGDHQRGKRWQSYWRRLRKKYPEDDALRIFKDYFDRRMIDPSKNLSVERKARLLPIAQKQPLEDVKRGRPL